MTTIDRRVMKFSAKIHLPLIRDAFDREALQVFNIGAYRGCTYVGPCALGVCIRPEDREYYDNIEDYIFYDDEDKDASISAAASDLTNEGLFEFNSNEEADDFITLQVLHDNASTTIVDLDKPFDPEYDVNVNFLNAFIQFSDHLELMERKYL